MIVDYNLGALLETWNKVLEDLDGVLIALVMDDPAEEVNYMQSVVSHLIELEEPTISALHSLRSVEIVALELDSVGKLALWRWRGANHFWKVLDYELHLIVLLRQVNANEPMAATDIDKGTAAVVDLGHVVVIKEVLNLIALSASKRVHSTAEALSTHWVLAEGGKHWLVSTKGSLEAALVVLLAAWKLRHSINRGCGRLSPVSTLLCQNMEEGGGKCE